MKGGITIWSPSMAAKRAATAWRPLTFRRGNFESPSCAAPRPPPSWRMNCAGCSASVSAIRGAGRQVRPFWERHQRLINVTASRCGNIPVAADQPVGAILGELDPTAIPLRWRQAAALEYLQQLQHPASNHLQKLELYSPGAAIIRQRHEPQPGADPDHQEGRGRECSASLTAA